MKVEINNNMSPGLKTGCGMLYCNVLHDDNGKVIKVLPNMGKMGGCASALISGMRHLMNLALRNGATIEEISSELADIGCHKPVTKYKDGKPYQIASCIDGIAQLIKYANNKVKEV